MPGGDRSETAARFCRSCAPEPLRARPLGSSAEAGRRRRGIPRTALGYHPLDDPALPGDASGSERPSERSADPSTGGRVVARTVFHGGVVFDGTGADPSRVDVAVADGRIVEVGLDLDGDEAVDIVGRGLLPGFIDCHAHVGLSEMRSTDEERAGRRRGTPSPRSRSSGRRSTRASRRSVMPGSRTPATATPSRRARFPGRDSSSRSSSSPRQPDRMTQERRRDSTPGSPTRASLDRQPTARRRSGRRSASWSSSAQTS